MTDAAHSNATTKQRLHSSSDETHYADVNKAESESINGPNTTIVYPNSINQSHIRQEINSLHEELELAQHGISKSGQLQRKIPRPQSKVRTRKRKQIERAEEQESEKLEIRNNLNIISAENNEIRHRLRGSKAALADKRILNDNLFVNDPERMALFRKKDDNDISYNNNETESSSEEEPTTFYDETDFEDGIDLNVLESDHEDDDVDNNAVEDTKCNDVTDVPPSTPFVTDESNNRPVNSRKTRSSRRFQNRLRNFKSQRLAQKHGAALGSHALGRPLEAIQLLKQVAAEAASAPQVYSSLGLVYDDMLKESQSKRSMISDDDNSRQQKEGKHEEAIGAVRNRSNNTNTRSKRKSLEANIADDSLNEQLDLAKKAYGAYHVAAILHKRDYNLWLRAADSALEIASIHVSIMRLTYIPDSLREYHRGERRRWLEESKNDYASADNLHPPGIDIPAKLAYVQIELGMYADALTLLTDLRNFPDFRSSYKAWLLYSDLMLRIGYECSQWNKNNSSVTNYMFRRWLRKLSKSFDWRERRLHALSKALEAACGSKACCHYMHWLNARVGRKVRDDADAKDGKHRWHSTDENESDPLLVGTEESEPIKAFDSDNLLDDETDDAVDLRRRMLNNYPNSLDAEEALLKKRHVDELASFDATTKELDLQQSSKVALMRNANRLQLLKEHEKSMQHLKSEYDDKFSEVDENDTIDSKLDTKLQTHDCFEDDSNHHAEIWEDTLTISASCEMVYSIASELLRQMAAINHLHDSDCFGIGGRLVCEAVSEYMKQRHGLRQKHIQERAKYGTKNEPFMSRKKAANTVDDISESLDVDDDILLSDDEFLISNDDSDFIVSLQRGILPPDLLILYGLCLMVKGGKDFIATQCISQIERLPHESRAFWYHETLSVDTSITPDSAWIFYRQSVAEPLGRTAFLALVADVIYKSGREKMFSKRVTALYRKHINYLTESKIVEEVLTYAKGKGGSIVQRHNVLFRVLVSAARFEVNTIEETLASQAMHDNALLTESLTNVLRSLTELFTFVWKFDKNARISTFCMETLDAMSRAFSLIPRFSKRIMNNTSKDFLPGAIAMMTQSAGLISDMALTADIVHEAATLEDLESFPFKSSWMTSELTKFAVRSFNLCVATNVSLFSGWENLEFSVRLMRHGNVPNFIGVSMTEAKVTGCLSIDNERSLSCQWLLARRLLLPQITFDFDPLLEVVKSSSEYKDANERLKHARSNHPIACYGEEEGLSVMLNFSHSCLIQAIATMDENNCNRLLLLALSIIVPATEFCLGVVIWDSAIGSSATSSQTNFDEWRNFDWEKDNVAPSNRQGYIRPKHRFIVPKDSCCLHEWFVGEEESIPLSNLTAVPVTILNKEWAKGLVDNNETIASDGIQAMDTLDKRIKRLRSCYSEEAVEKASLKVAESLLEVASTRNCHNPFVNIQLAVLFASQGQKGGTGDQLFKRKLPPRANCSVLDSLITIGRADCLQAIHFLLESAFLCSYVASVCSLHRDRLEVDYAWNTCWRIVSILNYDVSVAMRNAANTLGLDLAHEETSGIWERDVIDELLRARSDGIVWKGTLGFKVLELSTAPVSRTLTCRMATDVSKYRETGSEGSTGANIVTCPSTESLKCDTTVNLQICTFEEFRRSPLIGDDEDGEKDILVVEV